MAEQMKESGIQWIGAIPYNWNVERIKHIIQNNDNGIKVGPFGSALTNEVVSSDEGKYKVYGQSNLIRKDFSYGDNYVSEQNYKRLINYEVLPNDIAVSMMGTIGKCSVVPGNIEPGIMDSHLIKIRLSQKMLPRYFEYAYESDMGYSQLLINSKGSIMNGLNSTIVKGLYIPVPEIIEQQAIVDFLDKECAQIDSIAADLEKQIALLQQYKKSLITETVTKGLDKSVPMKDSGVEWIGKIPEHWNVTKIKYFCRMYSGENLTSADIEPDGDYPVYGGNGKRGYYSNFTNDGEHVLIGRQGALCGNVHLVSGKFWATDHAVVTYPTKEIINKYLYYLLQSMNLNQYSQSAAQPGLAVNVILALKACLPSTLKEQKTIVDFLDDKCLHVDQIILQKENQFNILQQHKKSLIYEYVTGKKRVKEVR